MNISTRPSPPFARLIVIGTLALTSAFATFLQAAEAKDPNLIPTTPGETPDYLCTWSLQGFVVNYTGVTPTRDALTEANIWGNGKYQNWAYFYPRIRKDLIFMMDDSWDVGMKLKNTGDCGGLQLNAERFPMTASATTEAAKLKILNQAFQAKGWRAVGGWVCAQKPMEFKDISDKDFYTQRLKAMNEAGWAYWKVDWGNNRSDEKWRRQLTELSHLHAPKLLVEHAINWSCVPFSDVFRTYDVEVMTSVPVTLDRVKKGLSTVAEPDAKGIINCEDEAVMAATLGCSMGIMRYPFVGNQPDGKQDFVFPPIGRDLKNCINEVERAVLWHRVAPPFKVDGKVTVDRAELEDSWYFKDREGWSTGAGKWARYRAPARMTRGDLPLPTVSILSGEPPFVIASRHPNGTVTIATLGRTLCKSVTDRSYALPLADITLQVGKLTGLVGVFGRYKSLTLIFDTALAGKTVLAQDILSLHSTNITDKVKASGNSLTIPGELIEKIGLAEATPGDKSDPGMVLSISK